jgi:DNA polymerase III subunit delta'
MTALFGNAEAQEAFAAALRSGVLHHAWLLVGPQGVGKARFAESAALRMLAEASASGVSAPGLTVPDDHPTRALGGGRVTSRPAHPAPSAQGCRQAGSGYCAERSRIAQVRTPATDVRDDAVDEQRVASSLSMLIDDLERNGANALLKNLEEPPVGTMFLLVSHAPGRLLPTIRSRCRLLRFGALDEADVRRCVARRGSARCRRATRSQTLIAAERGLAGAGDPLCGPGRCRPR